MRLPMSCTALIGFWPRAVAARRWWGFAIRLRQSVFWRDRAGEHSGKSGDSLNFHSFPQLCLFRIQIDFEVLFRLAKEI